ncbi:MAG: SRPBCC family protein [Pseudomonadota bacterium]
MKRLLLFSLLLTSAADAADLRSVSVEKDGGRYIMSSEVWFDASIEQVYAVLLDWDLSTEFSSVIVESRNLAPDDEGRPQYYSRTEACVVFFCMSAERSGVVEYERYAYIRSEVYPEQSDFHISDELWTFREEDGGTVVVYDLEFQPKFFVPPLIGPWMIKRKLREGGGDAIERIEAIAQDVVVDDS